MVKNALIAMLTGAILIRIATQLLGNDAQYFAGVYTFDTVALLYMAYTFSGLSRSLLLFVSGCAAWNLFKPLVESPAIDGHDVLYCLLGLIFVISEYVYKRVNH